MGRLAEWTTKAKEWTARLCPDWEGLSRIGRAKWVKSSYGFVIVIPLIAQLLEHLDPHYDITIGGAHFRLQMQLPFKWVMFYFGAVCFSAATAIFSCRCPHLIAHFSSPKEYIEEVNSELKLRLEMVDLYLGVAWNVSVESAQALAREFLLLACRESPRNNVDLLTQLTHQTSIRTDRMADAIVFIRNIQKDQRAKARVLCAALYGIGSVFFIVVMYQSFESVLRVCFR